MTISTIIKKHEEISAKAVLTSADNLLESDDQMDVLTVIPQWLRPLKKALAEDGDGDRLILQSGYRSHRAIFTLGTRIDASEFRFLIHIERKDGDFSMKVYNLDPFAGEVSFNEIDHCDMTDIIKNVRGLASIQTERPTVKMRIEKKIEEENRKKITSA